MTVPPSKRFYIAAPNYQYANHWARENGVPRRMLTVGSCRADASRFRGLPPGHPVILLGEEREENTSLRELVAEMDLWFPAVNWVRVSG